jgi:hypothetical protein
MRLLPGHTDYVRFILLGRSRIGTNFLRGLLNDHPQVVLFGEIFRNYNTVDFAYPGYEETPGLLSSLQKDPIRFLETRVYGRLPDQISAVGFKIFYYHARDEAWGPLWEHLVDQTSLRVIHMKRRNILKTHLSRRKAALTDSWVKTKQQVMKDIPVRLDFEDCLEDFRQTRAWEDEFDRLFAHHPTLEVVYEDLSEDYQAQMERVQKFLDLPLEPVRPKTYKQASLPLSQAIENYDELQTRFAGTPWEGFFVG